MKRFNRRAFLAGVGGIGLTLPFLPEFGATAQAKEIEQLPRFLTVYFPLGIPVAATVMELQSACFEPLLPFKDRILVFRNIQYVGEGKGHHNGKTHCFVGASTRSTDTAAGDSVDQAARKRFNEAYPDYTFRDLHMRIRSSNATAQETQNGGLHLNVQSWSGGGLIPHLGAAQPAEIFEVLTGRTVSSQRLEREKSVLDAVKGSSESLLSARGPLGAESKRKVGLYLEQIRDFERRLVELEQLQCEVPGMIPSFEQPIKPYEETVASKFELMLDAYILAFQCDPSLRFGSIVLGENGAHWVIKDELDGKLITSHNAHHAKREHLYTRIAKSYVELVAGLLRRLAMTPDFGGGDMLSNTMVMVGSELGDHANNHSLQECFYALAGLDARFKHGSYHAMPYSSVDMYTTSLRALGIDQVHGKPENHEGKLNTLLNNVPDTPQ